MADNPERDYRDSLLYMGMSDYLEYAETLMKSFDRLFKQQCVRNLDEQIMGFQRSNETIQRILESHRDNEREIPSYIHAEFKERLTAMTVQHEGTQYPADMHNHYRKQIQETLQIFNSHCREAASLAA